MNFTRRTLIKFALGSGFLLALLPSSYAKNNKKSESDRIKHLNAGEKLLLPKNPSDKDRLIVISDGKWTERETIISGNGQKIMGANQDIVLDVNKDLILEYNGKHNGWIVF